MIAFFSCLATLVVTIAVIHFVSVRPLRRKVDEMGRVFSAAELRNKVLHRMRKDEIARLRRLSGEEVGAISERLDEIETRKTALRETN
jgi:hypothetical protein